MEKYFLMTAKDFVNSARKLSKKYDFEDEEDETLLDASKGILHEFEADENPLAKAHEQEFDAETAAKDAKSWADGLPDK